MKNIIANNPGLTEAWDEYGKCSYWHAPAVDDLVTAPNRYGTDIDIGIIFYETARSIAAKVQFCVDRGMRCMFFWILSQMMDGSSCPIIEAITSELAAST
ncbi:MAG: hypothetical protein ACTSP4_13295 [Candidatus Hodarchaeales archaeon]